MIIPRHAKLGALAVVLALLVAGAGEAELRQDTLKLAGVFCSG